LYGEEALHQVEWIDRMQAMKFSLKEIATFVGSFQSHGTGPEMMAELNQIYSQKLAETHLQIERLTSLVTELKSALNYLQTCSVCTTPATPIHCRNCETHDEASPPLVAAVVNTI
jgi:DNA-binding transcriptional MerR regulator